MCVCRIFTTQVVQKRATFYDKFGECVPIPSPLQINCGRSWNKTPPNLKSITALPCEIWMFVQLFIRVSQNTRYTTSDINFVLGRQTGMYFDRLIYFIAYLFSQLCWRHLTWLRILHGTALKSSLLMLASHWPVMRYKHARMLWVTHATAWTSALLKAACVSTAHIMNTSCKLICVNISNIYLLQLSDFTPLLNSVKLYSCKFKFSKVVRQQIWGKVVDFIIAFSPLFLERMQEWKNY